MNCSQKKCKRINWCLERYLDKKNRYDVYWRFVLKKNTLERKIGWEWNGMERYKGKAKDIQETQGIAKEYPGIFFYKIVQTLQ